MYDADHILHFTQGLRPGDPPDGQGYLRKAYLQYYQALFEQDDKARNEMLLLANLEIGFHEQTRLQPEINEALTAAIISPQDFARNLLDALRPEGGWLRDLAWYIMLLLGRLTNFDAVVETYVTEAQRQAQFLVTETMMTIELPHNTRLRLGDDLTENFPPLLQQLSNPDLLELLRQIDPTPDSKRESGAAYWGDLPDRIYFIADMFRCYHMSPELLEPPFAQDQTPGNTGEV